MTVISPLVSDFCQYIIHTAVLFNNRGDGRWDRVMAFGYEDLGSESSHRRLALLPFGDLLLAAAQFLKTMSLIKRIKDISWKLKLVLHLDKLSTYILLCCTRRTFVHTCSQIVCDKSSWYVWLIVLRNVPFKERSRAIRSTLDRETCDTKRWRPNTLLISKPRNLREKQPPLYVQIFHPSLATQHTACP